MRSHSFELGHHSETLTVLRRLATLRDDGRDAHPSRTVLIVEVADTSYRIDHEYKTSLYARASIPDSWIVDLAHDTIERGGQQVVAPPDASS